MLWAVWKQIKSENITCICLYTPRACPWAEGTRGGFPAKGSNLPSLYLHTHSFVPLKDDGAEMDLQGRHADSRITLVACCAYIPEAQKLAAHTSQQGKVGTCVSESSRALPNFPWCHLLGWPQAHSVLLLLHAPVWEEPRYKAWVKREAISSLGLASGRTRLGPAFTIWTAHLISANLIFLICTTGTKMLAYQVSCGDWMK